MQTTHQAVELIKHFESFRPDPYYDVGGVITIGYGTDAPKARQLQLF